MVYMNTVTKPSLRISHYGSGKAKSSPVVVHVPADLQYQFSFVASYDFALALSDAYSRVSTASERQFLSDEVGKLYAGFQYGDDNMEGNMRECVRVLRAKNLAGYYDSYFTDRTPEEEELDKLGHLAALADHDYRLRSGIFTTSHLEDSRVRTTGRVIVDSALAVMLTSFVTAMVLMGNPEAIFLLLLGLGLRFSTPFYAISRVTAFREAAYRATPDEKKKALRTSFVKDVEPAEVLSQIARDVRAARLAEESVALQASIEDALGVIAEDEAQPKPSAITSVLEANDVESVAADLILAQRALLAELEARGVVTAR